MIAVATAPSSRQARPVARDLLVAPVYAADSWAALDLQPTDEPAGTPLDLRTADGPDAVRQGLIIRLLTPLGSLAGLGHAGFGSRLHELVGQPSTPALRDLARVFLLRAVLADPRVERVLALELLPASSSTPDRIEARMLVQARDLSDPVALGIEVAL